MSTELKPSVETYNYSTTEAPLHKDNDDQVPPLLFRIISHSLPGSFVSLETMEKLLQRKNTQAFLNDFLDENQRKLVEDHLRFCPYTDLCNFWFHLDLPGGHSSSCKSCSCKSECLRKNNCCPDILNFSNFSTANKDSLASQVECMAMSLKNHVSTRNRFEVVSKCPKHSNYFQLCTENLYQTFVDILPVTDKTNNVTYKNIHVLFATRERWTV